MRHLIVAVLAAAALLLPSCSRWSGGEEEMPSAYVRRTAVPNAVFFKDLGLEVEHFEVKALKNYKVTIWIETYLNGELRQDFSWGISQTPTEGKAIEEGFRFSRLHDLSKGMGEGKSNKVSWQFGFDNTSSGRGWKDNPFEGGTSTSTTSSTEAVELKSGQTITVWTLIGSDTGELNSEGGDKAKVKQNPFVIFIRCRMEPLGPEDRWSVFKSFDGVPGQ